MKGFFDPLPKTVFKKGTTYTCTDCGLESNGCRSPRMPVHGDGERGVLFVAEAPGKSEDLEGVQLVGDAGQLLRKTLRRLQFDLDRDAWKTNSVICRPAKNATPTPIQIAACRPNLMETVDRLKPSLIVLLGVPAFQSYWGLRIKEDMKSMRKWRGWVIPDRERQCYVAATYHPQFIIRSEKQPVVGKIFQQDMQQIMSYAGQPFRAMKPEEECVQVLHDPRQIKALLEEVLRTPPAKIAYDYETSGLKPQRAGHFIRSVAFATGPNTAYAFLLPERGPIRELWRRVLMDVRIRKIAHHLKFEDSWSRNILDVEVAGWLWCTQIGAHVCDNRGSIGKLKFQSFVQFGSLGYEDDVQSYLESKKDDPNGANAFNRVQEAPVKELLYYNGQDALNTYRLYLRQSKIINSSEDLQRGYDLLLQGTKELCHAEYRGMCVDLDFCQAQSKKYEEDMAEIEKELLAMPEVKRWKARMGKKFKLNSGDQIAEVLYKDLGLECKKKTDGGSDSTDKEALEGIDHPMAKALLRLRKIEKLQGTYLRGIMAETVDGIIHPFFHLHTVATYRSSSSAINFQNLPVRDPEARFLRKAFKARPGRQIVEIDYSGIEVRIGCCYHKDPMMVTYITDPTTDMHRDMAMECYVLSIDDMTPDPDATKEQKGWIKDARYCAKNKFVFPQFYGDWYATCAKNLWGAIDQMDLHTKDGVPMKQHLKAHKIGSYSKFEDHLEEVEDRFWNERFAVYTEWKESTLKEYERKGFIQLYTGFRCGGVMKKNEVLNYPIQGSAFHSLLWSFVHVSRYLRENGFESFPVGQIHDSIVLDAVPEELPTILPVIKRIMCEDLRKAFPWIIVPIDIEVEAAPVGGTWYDKSFMEIPSCN